jgi:hypothetical protein
MSMHCIMATVVKIKVLPAYKTSLKSQVLWMAQLVLADQIIYRRHGVGLIMFLGSKAAAGA